MDIAEMHVAFRQYAQQMGMQNVRAILPEQIDILLNQSITDTVNQLIRENIGVTNDRVITDNSKIGQINAFRTLYNVRTINITFPSAGNPTVEKPFKYDNNNKLIGLITHTDIEGATEDPVFGKYMFLVDISINYTARTGNALPITTNWYPVRIIDSAFLADSLNDFILKNRFRSPIACIYKDNTLELYIEKFDTIIGDTTPYVPKLVRGGTTLTPNQLRIDVIEKPSKVQYYADINDASTGVSCNLPENMHGDIVKHAVDLYRIALTGSLQSQQEAEQNQQRENVRNNYRNEGN